MKRTIRLLDIAVEVTEEGPGIWAEGAMGRTDIMASKILVNNKMNKDVKDSVLIHEVVHLISDIQGVELTEAQVCGIATGFYSFLMNNKEEVMSLYGV